MRGNRVNFTNINKMLQARIAKNPSASINIYLRLIVSKILSIETLLKLSAFENNKKDQPLPNILRETYTHLKDNIAPHIDIILKNIDTILNEHHLTEEDKKLFNGLETQLEDYKLMTEKRALTDFGIYAKAHYNAFQQPFSLCSALGGVYVSVDQGIDPYLGHIEENSELKDCPGICAGLVYEWIGNCVKEGENKIPLIGVNSVQKKHLNQFELDAQSATRIIYDIKNFEGFFDTLLESMDTRPVNIGITHSDPTASGHAWGLRKRPDGSIEFFDPNSGYFFLPNQKVFSFWFKEYVHYHQMRKLLGFGVNRIIFNFTEKDVVPLEQYFPSRNEYTQSIIQMTPKQRAIKITATLQKSIRNVNSMVGDAAYQEDELIKIINSTFKNYHDFINHEECLLEVVNTIDILMNGSADESKVKGLEKLIDIGQKNADLKNILITQKKNYEEKIKKVQTDHAKLDDELATLVSQYKTMKKDITDAISELSEAIKTESDDDIKAKIEIKINYLTNKSYRIEKIDLVKKALSSLDQSLDFQYTVAQAKKELATLENNTHTAENVIESLLLLLDHSASFIKKQIKDVTQPFDAYIQEQNLKRILSAIESKKEALKTLNNDKTATIEKIQALFYDPTASEELRNFINLIPTPDKLMTEIENKGKSPTFLKQFLNVKFPDITAEEIGELNALFTSDSEELPIGLKELKGIVYEYVNAENKNDISQLGLKILLCKLFGVNLEDKNISLIELIKKIADFYSKLLTLCDDYNALIDSYMVEIQLPPMLKNRIVKTFMMIKDKINSPATEIVTQLEKVAPGLANDLFHNKTDKQSCIDYFLLGDDTKDHLINIKFAHQMTQNIDLLTEYFNVDIRAALIKKHKWLINDINEYIDITIKVLSKNIKAAVNNMLAATTVNKATLCLINMQTEILKSINMITNGTPTIYFTSDVTQIDPASLNAELCAAIVLNFTNQRMDAKTLPLKDVDVLHAIKDDYEQMKTIAKGNVITSSFLPISYREYQQGHLNNIESTLQSIETANLNDLQSQYKNYRDRISLFRHSAKQVHAENWSAPRSTATAMRAFEAVIGYFESQDWEVDPFSFRIAEITTAQGVKKIVPRNAALIFDLYKQAKESTTTWQDALFQAEKILAENYKTVEVSGDFWGRKSSTQRAYNCAFNIIQENFHAMFFSDDLVAMLNTFQTQSHEPEGKVTREVNALIINALAVLNDNENDLPKHVIIQTLTDHLYHAINNLPWYRRMVSTYYKDVMQLIAQLTGWTDISREEEIKKVKKYMANEAVFFKARTKHAKEIGLEDLLINKDNGQFKV